MRRAAAGIAVVAILLSGCAAAPLPEVPTFPEYTAPPPPDPVQLYADDRLSAMTLDGKIASLLMVHVPGLDPQAIGGFASAYGLGGVILMGDNIPDPASTLADWAPLIAGERGLPALIATDQEGGVVRRIYPDDGPSAAELRTLDPAAARTAFADRGAMLKADGITVNFGIVADVTGDPDSFIFDRSMGSTPADAAVRVSEAVAGELGTVYSTLKHFPGHGVAPGDSHSSIPATGMSLDDWRAGHEEPFAAGIDAGAEFVMFGHLEFDAVDPVPATLSPMWHELLRDELGFDGIAITDDMNMLEHTGRPEYADPVHNAVLAVAAGNTMLLYVQGVDVAAVVAGIHAAVDAGTIEPSTIDDAARRLLVLRRTLSGETGPFVHCFDACLAIID
ncbi:MAG: glycoside hydrolase family 3 protein [Rhodoglobus sp.]|nr:glycoside hydrolase family 3 protein [Rhodoglobus sp.]